MQRKMFTGIVLALGKVVELIPSSEELRFKVDLSDLKNQTILVGDSISLNGACHTVEKLEQNTATFFSSEETLLKTNLSEMKVGDFLNLELSLTLSERLGGHIVTGHVDDLIEVEGINKLDESWVFEFRPQAEFMRYVIPKGSVCINGISLTVAEKKEKTFTIAIIPHTYENTNLRFCKTGDKLNFEVDMLAKYVESILADR
jgi:riboflavin synthase